MRHYGRVVVSLAAAACMLFSGTTNANAAVADNTRFDMPVALSNVRVERSGERIANVSFDYNIDAQETTGQRIKSICFTVSVANYTAVTPVTGSDTTYPDPTGTWINCNTISGDGVSGDDGRFISDEDLKETDYDRIYGAQTDSPRTGYSYENGKYSEFTAGKVDGQNFTRYHSIAWDGKTSGHQTMAIPGLEPGVGYTSNADLSKLNQYETSNYFGSGVISPDKYMILYSEYLYKTGVRTKTSVENIQAVTLRAVINTGEYYYWDDVEGDGQKFLEIPATPSVSFRDVDASTPHADDIKWTASAGISTGWIEPDGTRTFRGMDTVKRQDMAAFLRREAKRMGVKDADSWKPSASDWKAFRDVSGSTPHAEDVLWLAHAGITTGWKESDGTRTYRGMDSVKRQDMAAFMHRLAKLAARGSHVSPKSFGDVDASTPHADDIRWLAGSGVSTGYPDGTYRGMVSVYRQDMAAFLHRLDTLK